MNEKLVNSSIFQNIQKLNQFELGDLTQKTLSQSGKLDFILRKGKNFENIWHNINDIKSATIIKRRATTVLTNQEINLTKNDGGSIYSSESKSAIQLNIL